MNIGYVYETTNLINGKKYIGMHANAKFNKSYLGSGKILLRAINKHGKDNFNVKVLEWHKTKESLQNAERRVIKERNAQKDTMYYNIAEGGQWGDTFGGMSKTQKNKVGKKISLKRKQWWKDNPEQREIYSKRFSQIAKSRIVSDETKEKIKAGQKKWRENNPEAFAQNQKNVIKSKIKNGTLNNWSNPKNIHPWIGRKHSKETKQKVSDANKGFGIITPCILFYENECIKEFENMTDMRKYLKNELNWKKTEWIGLNENDILKGYSFKKLERRRIKSQTTIEK